MDFHVLGALRVTHEGEPLELGGPKQQTTLAVLIVHAGEVVSADRLIDEVWGDAAPASSRRTLQSFVSNLRRELNADEEILRGRAPGYILELAPDAVDSLRFSSMVEAASASDGPEKAASLLREALALWQGRPFDGLYDNSPALYAEMVRLEEARINAVESRIEAELALERHRDLIAELDYLTTEHPLREHLWHQYMRALYASGRQADALRAYQKARHLLAEELGLEPGSELQDLEQRILLQDLDVDSPDQPVSLASGPPRPGHTVRGYEFREVVQKTDDATTLRAYQSSIGREVAVTYLNASTAGKPGFIRSFDAEMQRIARLEHPFIPPVYDSWREPRGAFIVSRWVDGVTLRTALDRGLWRWEAAARAVSQIAGALASAHAQGITHGDITSESVVVDKDGNSYLLGFPTSLVRRAGDDRPEADIDAAMARDVRMLAVILLEALTGATPPDPTAAEATVQRWVDQHLSGPDSPVPGDLTRVIRGAAGVPSAPVTDAATVQRALVTDPTAMPESALPGEEPIPNPYKGLRAFDEADAEDFHGRDALIAQLVAALSRPDNGRLLAVVGPSGSGKSSVVKAGLIPALRKGALPGSNRWFVAAMVPGRYPFEELRGALRGVAGEENENVLELLTDNDPTGLARGVDQILPDPDDELLLVVDQFEELYTLTSEGLRRAFIDSIVTALREQNSRLRVVITLRADYYDRPLADPDLGRMVRDGLVTVVALTPGELHAAITGPAERVGVRVDPDLVDHMIADLIDRPGALPLLQYTLSQLFESRDGHTLNLDAYDSIGGIDGALGRQAERVFASLSDDTKKAARRLFLRLVTLEGPARETRNRANRRSLTMVQDGGAMSRALEAYGGARLLLFDADPVSGLPTVEVAHEALFSAWPRLQSWIETARGSLRIQRRLEAAVREWVAHERDDDYLASGRRLAEFEAIEEGELLLSPAEEEYIGASRRRAKAADRRRSRRRSVVIGILLMVAIGTGLLAAFAFAQRRASEREARTSLARELAAAAVANLEIDPELSVLLALEAVEATSPDGVVLPEAEEALHRSIQADRLIAVMPDVAMGAFSPIDPGRLVVVGGEGEMRIVDTSGRAILTHPEPHGGSVTALAFDRDRGLVASGDGAGTAKVWNPASGWVAEVETSGLAPVVDVALSADGSLLATAHATGTGRVWRIEAGEATEVAALADMGPALSFDPSGTILGVADPLDPIVRLVDWSTGTTIGVLEPGATVADVDFGADGAVIATASAEGVTVWDVSELTPVATFPAGSRDAMFDAAGASLATAGDDGLVRVWDNRSASLGLELAGHRGRVLSVSFDATGSRLFSTGIDGIGRVWDVSGSGRREWATLPLPHAVRNVAFDGEARRLVASGATSGGASFIWDVDGWETLAMIPAATTVAISPDGARYASAVAGTVTMWDLASGSEIFERSPQVGITGLTFGADGRLLITGNLLGTVSLWDALTGRDVAVMPGGHIGAVDGLSIDDDDELLMSVSSDADEASFIWSLARAREVSRLDSASAINAGTLRPDGSVAATGGPDGITRFWDTATGTPLTDLRLESASPVRSIAFSPDATRIATASDDGSIRIWDATTGGLLMRWFAHEGGATDVAYSNDGRFLVSTGADAAVRVYVTDVDELVDLAHTRVDRTFTASECRRFLHLEACPED